MGDERYGTPDAEAEVERVRLDMLAETLDPCTFAALDRAGIGPGDRVLEAGSGNGSVAAWMAERVGPSGHVLSVDIDLRFHAAVPDHVEVRELDLEEEALDVGDFDLVHARALLQHLPTRDAVLERLLAAVRPGGRLVVEDGVFEGFARQPLDPPYRDLHALVANASLNEWRDPDYGLRLLDSFGRLGLRDLDVTGHVWAMRPGEPGGDWWFLALERAFPRMVAAGAATQEQVDEALAQVRRPDFALLSPVHVSVTGTRPD